MGAVKAVFRSWDNPRANVYRRDNDIPYSWGTAVNVQMMAALPLTLWNMYGPTETTVWSTCWQVPPQPSYIRIGGPIDNTRIHIVDAHDQEVPVGAAGEIVIAGEGVALGYLNRPELTEDRFIPDDFIKNHSEQNQSAHVVRRFTNFAPRGLCHWIDSFYHPGR